MSSVFRAQDVAAGDTEVAVKILDTSHGDDVKQELFKRETGALRRLQHPNIVTLRHSGWLNAEQAFYLVFDYYPIHWTSTYGASSAHSSATSNPTAS